MALVSPCVVDPPFCSPPIDFDPNPDQNRVVKNTFEGNASDVFYSPGGRRGELLRGEPSRRAERPRRTASRVPMSDTRIPGLCGLFPQSPTTLSVRRPSCDSTAVIVVGQPAPDAAFASRDGGGVRLSDLWREKPTILLFLRHFG